LELELGDENILSLEILDSATTYGLNHSEIPSGVE
jgi:hypothetical protein